MRSGGFGRISLRPFAFSAAVLLLVASCGGATAPGAATSTPAAASAAASTAAPSEAPVVIQMGVVSNILNAPYYVGLDTGIYLKHGIDLKITTVAAGTDGIRGLQAGQYQLTSNAWVSIAAGFSQGVPFKVLAMSMGGPVANYDDHITLLVGPDSKATKPAEIKGATVAVGLGTGPETWLRTTLKNVGLDADKDIKMVNVTQPNIQSALQSRAATVGVPIEPYSSQIVAQIPGSRIIGRGGGIVDSRVMLTVLDPWLQQNQKTVEKIVAAHLETSQYIRQHPDEAAAATSRYLSGLDPKILAAAMKVMAFDPRWSPKIQQGFDETTAQLLRDGAIKTAPKSSDILVLDRLTTLEKTYPQYFTDLK